MTERIGHAYQPLFEVRLLHHYWLDHDNVIFDDLPKDASERAALTLPEQTPTREQRLSAYDVRQFLNIFPTATTQEIIKGLHAVFLNTALGFVVIIPKTTLIPDDVVFDFAITIASIRFVNYTALTWQAQKIVELYHQAEDKTYRYKENVAVFSNLRGSKRATDLYLSQEIPTLSPSVSSYPLESLLQLAGGLVQIKDELGSTHSLYSGKAVNTLPIFSHQGDIPEVILPPGLETSVPKGVMLKSDLPDNIYALIRLSAVRANDDDFSYIDNVNQQHKGLPKKSHPIYQIRFKNRSTQWFYYDKTKGITDQPIFQEADPLPLTFFANRCPDAPIKKRKPSEGLVKAIFDNSDPPKVTGLVSEIFEKP